MTVPISPKKVDREAKKQALAVRRSLRCYRGRIPDGRGLNI